MLISTKSSDICQARRELLMCKAQIYERKCVTWSAASAIAVCQLSLSGYEAVDCDLKCPVGNGKCLLVLPEQMFWEKDHESRYDSHCQHDES